VQSALQHVNHISDKCGKLPPTAPITCGSVAHACSHTAAYTQSQGQPQIKPVAFVQFPAKREFVLKVNAMDPLQCRGA